MEPLSFKQLMLAAVLVMAASVGFTIALTESSALCTYEMEC